MSDYLLLLNPHQCPVCRRPHSIPQGYGECRKCGILLFDNKHDFDGYAKETGWREFWVFTHDYGWKHYSQIHIREEALSRVVKAEAGEAVTPEYQQRKLYKARKEAREKIQWYLKQKKTIRSFGK